ncbi:MAG: hypothetical protein LWW85_02975 [Marinilabiliales bacterium]|nr:hypothetical protein [Marinilabiliales bacterium]
MKIIKISEASSVGILWNPSDEESIETYEALRKILAGKGIKSFGMAFIASKREKDTLSTVSNSWLINYGNVSFFGKPLSGDGIHFMQQEFDLLIDLSILKCVPLQYILVHSNARFKVGWQSTDPNLYDLEIDVSAQPGCRYLMEQTIFYLEKLNENS